MKPNLKDLNESLTQLETDKISPEVAVSDEIEDYENKKVVFSFEVYNQNQCEISRLSKSEAKKLTKELKKISLVRTKHLKSQQVSGVACKSISNSGNYSVLFTDLPPDTEMLEIDYTSAGRIFGHLTHNIFNIVAVNKRHR